MIKKILIFLFLIIPRTITMPPSPHVVIWNVGQGAWFTLDKNASCVHIDMGGSVRHRPTPCPEKDNRLFITHYDQDHISLVSSQAHKARHCLMENPPPHLSSRKQKMLATIPRCLKRSDPSVQRLYQSRFQKRNESNAYLVANTFLITGDADKKMERAWATRDLPQVSFFLNQNLENLSDAA